MGTKNEFYQKKSFVFKVTFFETHYLNSSKKRKFLFRGQNYRQKVKILISLLFCHFKSWNCSHRSFHTLFAWCNLWFIVFSFQLWFLSLWPFCRSLRESSSSILQNGVERTYWTSLVLHTYWLFKIPHIIARLIWTIYPIFHFCIIIYRALQQNDPQFQFSNCFGSAFDRWTLVVKFSWIKTSPRRPRRLDTSGPFTEEMLCSRLNSPCNPLLHLRIHIVNFRVPIFFSTIRSSSPGLKLPRIKIDFSLPILFHNVDFVSPSRKASKGLPFN